MLSKSQMLAHPHNVKLVERILLHQLLQQASFRLRKLVIDLCVAIDLYCYVEASLVILTRNYLCKTALTQHSVHFESVQQVIALLHIVVAFVIVKVIAITRLLRTEVDLVPEVAEFNTLELSQLICVEAQELLCLAWVLKIGRQCLNCELSTVLIINVVLGCV